MTARLPHVASMGLDAARAELIERREQADYRLAEVGRLRASDDLAKRILLDGLRRADRAGDAFGITEAHVRSALMVLGVDDEELAAVEEGADEVATLRSRIVLLEGDLELARSLAHQPDPGPLPAHPVDDDEEPF